VVNNLLGKTRNLRISMKENAEEDYFS